MSYYCRIKVILNEIIPVACLSNIIFDYVEFGSEVFSLAAIRGHIGPFLFDLLSDGEKIALIKDFDAKGIDAQLATIYRQTPIWNIALKQFKIKPEIDKLDWESIAMIMGSFFRTFSIRGNFLNSVFIDQISIEVNGSVFKSDWNLQKLSRNRRYSSIRSTLKRVLEQCSDANFSYHIQNLDIINIDHRCVYILVELCKFKK
jgi:hypothetical protein